MLPTGKDAFRWFCITHLVVKGLGLDVEGMDEKDFLRM